MWFINDKEPFTYYKAKLLSKDIQTAEVVIYDDWLRNSLNPLYLGKQEKYKSVKLKILIKDATDQLCLFHLGNLVQALENCTIYFEDLTYYYDCLLINKTHQRLEEGIYLFDVELKSGYAYTAEVTQVSHQGLVSINNNGNMETPAIIEITPLVNLVDATFIGLGDEYVIKNLTAGKKVIIDGVLGTVLENGLNKFSDFNAWSFPRVRPGENGLAIYTQYCDVTVKYKPRFM